MGGPPPIHLSMAIYSGLVYINNYNISECQYKQKIKGVKTDMFTSNNDVLYMSVSHSVCILLYILQRSFKTM